MTPAPTSTDPVADAPSTQAAETGTPQPGPLETEALEHIRALIRIDSVNTGDAATIGDGETRAALYVKKHLDEVGYETVLVEPRPGRASVIARLPGSDPDAGALVAHAHLDVVPVDVENWTHPPFGAEIHDGILYGRGAVDMKDFAGMLLAIARAFRRDGIVPRRDLIFAFFADEEAGGVWGARWIVENRPELFEGATEALSEVGGFSIPLPDDRRAYLVATAEKGVTVATLTARGSAAHGSRPTSDNAVVRLAQAVAAVGVHRFPAVRTATLERFLEVYGQASGKPLDTDDLSRLGFAASVIDAGTRNTASPTVLAAGGKINVIPAAASATLDVRVVPGQAEAVRAQLADVVGDDIEVAWARDIPAIESPVDAPLLDVLQDAVTAEDAGGTVVPYLLPASTDNKHLARLGIRGYGFVPLRVPADFDVYGQFHAADERVPVDAVYFGTRVTARILRDA